MTNPRFSSLDEWLRWQEGLHPSRIDLGLERVRKVARALDVTTPAPTTISVAGTNGKGSTVTLIEGILGAAGYRTGAYMSPHLLRYNERVRIDGREVGDDALCEAFAAVDDARAETSLTYFEFGTLAALWLFRRAAVDVAILEVGLGGRLDAVNAVDADGAIVTSVGLDHTQWLGPDRDSIGREKAGIWRAARPAVCGDPVPPDGLLEAATCIGTNLHLIKRDFDFDVEPQRWHWRGMRQQWDSLPLPAVPGAAQFNNAASALALLETLAARLPVSRLAVETGLEQMKIAGRLQQVPGEVPVLLDVGHNAEAATVLADFLAANPVPGRNLAVIGMLDDKPARTVARTLDPYIAGWYAGGLDGERALSGDELASRLIGLRAPVVVCETVPEAYGQASASATPGDRIVVLGSFRTVAAVSESARWMK